MSCLCDVWLRESFDVDNMEQEPQARMLLDQMVHLLQEVAQQNPNVVERVKLQHISKNMVCTTNIPKTHYYSCLEAAASYKSVKIMILKRLFKLGPWGPWKMWGKKDLTELPWNNISCVIELKMFVHLTVDKRQYIQNQNLLYLIICFGFNTVTI